MSRAMVTKRIAQETGRSAETIRYTLKHFDLEHPDMAIFPHNHGPLRTETKWEIYQQYRRGESVQALAQRFCQTRTRIYRIINEMRAARIMELPLDYIGNEQFARLRSEKKEARDLGAAAGKRSADEEAAVAQRSAPVSGQPVRGAPADAGAGGPSLSEDELPQVQGEHAPRDSSI